MKCIYCLEDKLVAQFQHAEHVIPRSFGHFPTNNFVLNSDTNRMMVCDHCNQYFGDHLELVLARDSLEGIYRPEYRVQKPRQFKGAGRGKRVKISVAEGPLKGAHAFTEYSEDAGRVVVSPLPQIGFLDRSGDHYHWFLLDQLPNRAFLQEHGYRGDDRQAFLVIDCPKDIVAGKLKTIGVNFAFTGLVAPSIVPSTKPTVKCKVTGEWDKDTRRALAKIAFNYLAYWEGPEILLGSSFNPIRDYIRHGTPLEPDPVTTSQVPILPDERPDGDRRMAHLLNVGWAEHGSLIANVSLHNWMTHIVVLAQTVDGVRKPMPRSHYFSIKTREITELRTQPMLQTCGQ